MSEFIFPNNIAKEKKVCFIDLQVICKVKKNNLCEAKTNPDAYCSKQFCPVWKHLEDLK